jgi:DNA invertase Pin-like site-specific DNA recombinase
VGYARVSTEGQNLGRQLAALHQEGCDPIFSDKASGKSVRGRPGLDKAIKALRPGNVLVLAEWDRATRSMLDGIAIMERVHERGATIKARELPNAKQRGIDKRVVQVKAAPDKQS